MAQLKDLIVAGASRFLGKTYFEDSVTFNDTLILAKSQDLSGTADSRPALIIGGLPTGAHIEIDANEIQAKGSGTTTASIHINYEGGDINLGKYVVVASDGDNATGTGDGALRIAGGLSTTKTSYFGGAITAASTLGVSGKTTLSGEALLKGVTKIENTLNVTKAVDFDSTLNVDGKLTLGGNIAYQNGSYTDYDMIKFITGTGDGAGIVIGGGGLAVFGSGESASNLVTAAGLAGSQETTYITSDNEIQFYTNCQAIANKAGVILDTSRYFYPDVNNTGSLGTTERAWNSLYVNTATINGNTTIKGGLTVNGNTNLKGTLTLGTYKDQATPPLDGGIAVLDLRNATITPESFGDKRVNFYFDQITDDFYTTTSATTPSSSTKWMGIMHIKGWQGNTYAAWELGANADTSSIQDTLRFRQGIGTTWGAWQSVITDANMSQYMDGRYVNITGDSMSGHLYMTGSHASQSTSNTSQIVMGTSSAQHYAITSNDKAVVFNPSTSTTTNQIVLYLKSGTQSVFPNGISVGGILSTSSGADASGSTGSGDLRVAGGAGIAKKLYVGSNLVVAGGATLGDATSDTHKVNGNLTHNGIVYYANGTTYYVNASGSAKFSGLNVAGNAAITGTMNIGGNTTIGDATGDVHKVNGNMTHNGVVYFANGTTYYINNSGTGYLNALTTNGAVKMNGNTASSSMTTGQLVINGGAGLSGQLNAKSVRIDNAVKFEYNSTDKCVDVIFG